MTTLVATLPPGLARSVAATADWLDMTHSELAIAALRVFVQGARQERRERTNERTNERSKASATSAAPAEAQPMIAREVHR